MAIETKNKLVTLEDLRTAYNDLVAQIGGGMTDITNQLTWQTGKAVKMASVSGSYVYSWETPDQGQGTSDQYINKCYFAQIDSPTAGDVYRITGWCKNDILHGLYAVLDSDGYLIDTGYPEREADSKRACGDYIYETIEMTVPTKAAKLMILNWNKQIDTSYSLEDIIVKKG